MGFLGAIWGFTGVVSLLAFAIYRLAPRAWESLQSPLSGLQWAILVLFAAFMLVAEGYKGFQKKFSPRTAARVRYLKENPTALRVLLAPFFCMGFFFANRKTRITSFCLTTGIILLVALVRYLPAPWRGIVDFGVVLGLSYGILSFCAFTVLALRGEGISHSPEIPS